MGEGNRMRGTTGESRTKRVGGGGQIRWGKWGVFTDRSVGEREQTYLVTELRMNWSSRGVVRRRVGPGSFGRTFALRPVAAIDPFFAGWLGFIFWLIYAH